VGRILFDFRLKGNVKDVLNKDNACCSPVERC
jgi:hypothetical protein